jgi:hypothetical protein
MEVRAEFQNVLNRLQWVGPSSSNALATQVRNAAGVPTSGLGYIIANSVGGEDGTTAGAIPVVAKRNDDRRLRGIISVSGETLW